MYGWKKRIQPPKWRTPSEVDRQPTSSVAQRLLPPSLFHMSNSELGSRCVHPLEIRSRSERCVLLKIKSQSLPRVLVDVSWSLLQATHQQITSRTFLDTGQKQ